MSIDVGIIGMGRVGLPLALSLCRQGFSVRGFDIDENKVDLVNRKIMPFQEAGCERLIKEVNLRITTDFSQISQARHIIITVGTPLLSHIETDLSQIKRVLDSIKKHLREDTNLILRSTVAPGTTEYVRRYLERETGLSVGSGLFLSFCPERIMEGRALEELLSLPQVIGSEDQPSAARSEELFSSLTEHILHTDYTSAELIKLFNNISRYVRFGLANQFALTAEEYGKNIFPLIEMANYNYPRDLIAQPGLTAGTCLRKDFGMINENIPYLDMLISAWKVNEYMPNFLVRGLKKRAAISGRVIGILGYTFKKNTDDIRDSLVPKLIRYLEREVPDSILVYDPYLKKCSTLEEILEKYDPYLEKCSTLEEMLEKAEIIFFAVNHSLFAEKMELILEESRPGVIFVDIWNISRQGRIFFSKEELRS